MRDCRFTYIHVCSAVIRQVRNSKRKFNFNTNVLVWAPVHSSLLFFFLSFLELRAALHVYTYVIIHLRLLTIYIRSPRPFLFFIQNSVRARSLQNDAYKYVPCVLSDDDQHHHEILFLLYARLCSCVCVCCYLYGFPCDNRNFYSIPANRHMNLSQFFFFVFCLFLKPFQECKMKHERTHCEN